jgi:hypothetical protein
MDEGGRWFRRRESGLGWTPVSWQGWLVTLLGVVVVLLVDLAILGRIGIHHR